MKKVEFGYNDDRNPNGQWKGIGISPDLGIINADYYGAIKYDGNNYLIAKVVEDRNNRFPYLLNKFIVKPAIADMYADGSGNIFLDMEDSLESDQIQAYLNRENVKDNIKDIRDVITYCHGTELADRTFTYLTLGDSFITTSIPHDNFQMRNDAIKSCRKSFSELQQSYQLSQNSGYSR